VKILRECARYLFLSVYLFLVIFEKPVVDFEKVIGIGIDFDFDFEVEIKVGVVQIELFPCLHPYQQN